MFTWLIEFVTIRWLIFAPCTLTAVFGPFTRHLWTCKSRLWHFHDSLSSWKLDDSFLREHADSGNLPLARHPCICKSSLWHFHDSLSSWQLDNSILCKVRWQQCFARSWDTWVYAHCAYNIFMTHYVCDNEMTHFCEGYVDSGGLPVRESPVYMHIEFMIFTWLSEFVSGWWLVFAWGTSRAVVCPFVRHLHICKLSLWSLHDSLSSWQLEFVIIKCSGHTCAWYVDAWWNLWFWDSLLNFSYWERLSLWCNTRVIFHPQPHPHHTHTQTHGHTL